MEPSSDYRYAWLVGGTEVHPEGQVQPGHNTEPLGPLVKIVHERRLLKEQVAERNSVIERLKAENERLRLEAMQGAAAPLMATCHLGQDSGTAGLYAILGNLPELIAALGKEIRAKDQPSEPFTRVNVKGDVTIDGVPAQRCTCCNRYYDKKIGSVMVRESVTLKAVPDGPNVPQHTFTITLPSGQTITVTE